MVIVSFTEDGSTSNSIPAYASSSFRLGDADARIYFMILAFLLFQFIFYLYDFTHIVCEVQGLRSLKEWKLVWNVAAIYVRIFTE